VAISNANGADVGLEYKERDRVMSSKQVKTAAHRSWDRGE